MLALDFLRVLFAHFMFLRVDMPPIGTPAIGVQPRNTTRLKSFFERQKDRILPPSKDVRQHGPTDVIDGMPPPPRLRFLTDITPHLVEL